MTRLLKRVMLLPRTSKAALSRLPVGSCEPAKQGDERQPGGLLPDTPLPRPFFGGRDDPLKKRILIHGCAL
jgi:hypothetical protein